MALLSMTESVQSAAEAGLALFATAQRSSEAKPPVLATGIPIQQKGNDDIVLSTQNVAWVETNWPVYTGGAVVTPYDNNFAMIAVDPMGRTLNPNSLVMVTQTMTLNVTHRDMVSGSLRPLQTRTIRISPLYTVSVDKH